MCRKNSADREREVSCAPEAWEGKIKGRGTSSRARHCLHIGFGGTPLLRGVPNATRGDCAAYFRTLGSMALDGA
jgi:hypothetical protein